MRKIILPSGRTAEVALHHTMLRDGRRTTVAHVACDEGVIITQATCSTQDTFMRRTGRLIATRRVNDVLKNKLGWDRKDRGAVFKALFAPKPKQVKKAKTETAGV
jgi:hypothetical protein